MVGLEVARVVSRLRRPEDLLRDLAERNYLLLQRAGVVLRWLVHVKSLSGPAGQLVDLVGRYLRELCGQRWWLLKRDLAVIWVRANVVPRSEVRGFSQQEPLHER